MCNPTSLHTTCAVRQPLSLFLVTTPPLPPTHHTPFCAMQRCSAPRLRSQAPGARCPQQHHIQARPLQPPQLRQPAGCQAAPVSFEPHVDSQALAAQLVVLSATVGTAAFWWLSVVPSARRTLAKEKRAGPLNEYLVELQDDKSRGLERWFYTDWLQQLQQRQQMARAAAAKRTAAAAAAAATQLGTSAGDTQQAVQNAQQTQHQGAAAPTQLSSSPQEPPAGAPAETDDDKQPSFWSLDNPILATAAMLAAIAVVSSILHG